MGPLWHELRAIKVPDSWLLKAIYKDHQPLQSNSSGTLLIPLPFCKHICFNSLIFFRACRGCVWLRSDQKVAPSDGQTGPCWELYLRVQEHMNPKTGFQGGMAWREGSCNSNLGTLLEGLLPWTHFIGGAQVLSDSWMRRETRSVETHLEPFKLAWGSAGWGLGRALIFRGAIKFRVIF